MALWFLRGLRRGVVTTRYPRAVDPWASLLPTPPRFHPERLTGELADRLVDACPTRAIQRDGDLLVVDLGACAGCGRCLRLGAPAVEPSGHWELSARSRADLRKRVPIRGGP